MKQSKVSPQVEEFGKIRSGVEIFRNSTTSWNRLEQSTRSSAAIYLPCRTRFADNDTLWAAVMGLYICLRAPEFR